MLIKNQNIITNNSNISSNISNSNNNNNNNTINSNYNQNGKVRNPSRINYGPKKTEDEIYIIKQSAEVASILSNKDYVRRNSYGDISMFLFSLYFILENLVFACKLIENVYQ